MPLNNQPCLAKLTIINFNHGEVPFCRLADSLDEFTGSYYILYNLSNRLYVPNEKIYI